ncbi:MAG: hypothetical protein ACOZAN_03630 [Patescibacteria group bacterium]
MSSSLGASYRLAKVNLTMIQQQKQTNLSLHGHQIKTANQAGFTVIELLIVTLLSVMLMMAVSTVFMTFMLNSAKLSIEQSIKAEGSHTVDQIATILRNARTIESCTTDMVSVVVRDVDDQQLQIYTTPSLNGEHRIAVRNLTTNTTKNFTSADNTITPSLRFNCFSDDNSTFVSYSFGLKRGPGIEPDRDTAIINFSGSVEMRNL